jgi:hypothetical protein
MKAKIRRMLYSCFVINVAVGALVVPAPADAQYVQTQAAEGSHIWRQDNWCYVVHGGRLVRTSYFRTFPDPRNRNVFDIFDNGRYLRRVTLSVQRPAETRQSGEAQLRGLINQLNRLTAGAPTPATSSSGMQRGTMAYCPGMTGPFIAPNVRANIPMYGCQTPEEKAHMARSNGETLTGEALTRLGANCQNRRAHDAYREQRQLPNGTMVYILDDGSAQPRGGTLNAGWMWGVNGMPQHKEGCF